MRNRLIYNLIDLVHHEQNLLANNYLLLVKTTILPSMVHGFYLPFQGYISSYFLFSIQA
jgi:hypothetical protein